MGGLHEPIIPEELFYQVQSILDGRKQEVKKRIKQNEWLPLRGFLQCRICGGNLTGSASTSHTGTKYYYYHCTNGCKERFRADEANMLFIEYLGSFKVPEEVLELYYRIMEDQFKNDDRQREKEKSRLLSQINEFEKLIENVEDKFTSNEIDKTTYNNAKKRYNHRIDELRIKIQEVDLQDSDFMRYVSYDFSLGEIQNKKAIRNDGLSYMASPGGFEPPLPP